jgi:hypothetical protein
MNKIIEDLNLTEKSPPIQANTYLKEELEDKGVAFEYMLKRWSKSDYQYWLNFGITTKALKKFKVRCCSFIASSKSSFFTYTKEEPIFLYEYEEGLKMYRPLSEKRYK